jgi:hypothetical protein
MLRAARQITLAKRHVDIEIGEFNKCGRERNINDFHLAVSRIFYSLTIQCDIPFY